MSNQKFFFIGIKGSGMSALACVLKQSGASVIGSDITSIVGVEEFLDQNEIKYYDFDEFDFDASYTIVAGNSFQKGFSEYDKAVLQGNEIFDYTSMLGKLSEKYPSVAVTGTHGKTTTTTYTADVLSNIANVGYLIGDGNGHMASECEYFVFEACEYRNHYFNYFPKYAIITNITYDHHDFFKTKLDYNKSFLKFSENVIEKLIVCGEDETICELFKGNEKCVFYGLDNYNDIQARNVKYNMDGINFEFYAFDEFVTTFQTPLYGEHNLLNLLGALAIAYLENKDLNKIANSTLGKLKPHRRLEEYYFDNQVVISDYAHHPNEVKAAMDAVMHKFPNKKFIVLFQPHTVARVEAFYTQFAKELNKADEVILIKTYKPPRDHDLYGDDHIDSDVMLSLIKSAKMFEENQLETLALEKNCVILFAGASIYPYTKRYIDKLIENK